MNAFDITARSGQGFVLSCLEAATTAALDARSVAMLAFVRNSLSAYNHRIVNAAEQARAALILARVEAGTRWLGGRHA